MLKNAQKDFIQRHIGPSIDEQNVMLKELGYQNLDDLIKDTVPEKILLKDDLDIGDPNSEYKALRKLKDISKKNKIYSSFIGMGYYGTYISGEIIENNQAIVDDPAKVNNDPENEAWFFKLKITDKSEMDSLMNKEEYEKFSKESGN